MSQKLDDLRIRRTRAALEKALVELTIEKGFAALTVRDIAERARVNRSTFYRHYVDKYDLLRNYIVECFETLYVESDQPALEEDDPDNDAPPAVMVRVLKHIQDNTQFYRVILGKGGETAFYAESIRHYVAQQMRGLLSSQMLPLNPRRPPIDFVVSYVLHAGIGAIIWWLEHEQSCTLEMVTDWLNQLSRSNVNLSLGFEF